MQHVIYAKQKNTKLKCYPGTPAPDQTICSYSALP